MVVLAAYNKPTVSLLPEFVFNKMSKGADQWSKVSVKQSVLEWQMET